MRTWPPPIKLLRPKAFIAIWSNCETGISRGIFCDSLEFNSESMMPGSRWQSCNSLLHLCDKHFVWLGQESVVEPFHLFFPENAMFQHCRSRQDLPWTGCSQCPQSSLHSECTHPHSPRLQHLWNMPITICYDVFLNSQLTIWIRGPPSAPFTIVTAIRTLTCTISESFLNKISSHLMRIHLDNAKKGNWNENHNLATQIACHTNNWQ